MVGSKRSKEVVQSTSESSSGDASSSESSSESSSRLASFPGLPHGGRKAWYTLREHARNFLLKLHNTQVGVCRKTSSASFCRSCVANYWADFLFIQD